ncbi:Mu transposase C-terminal domain-containing protein [Clostridium butyricum]|uniref:Mu transposase C-terminal domain-containing protein n=1 Tax=Clostridium butyricum TaxID=1492 RepID=UPI0011DDEC6C|nr:Mu transposase C-terminal domain-containing protein [Clostridium butyricum]
MIFKENMIFSLKDEKYRIIDSDENNIFIIELTEKVKWPQVIETNDLEKLFINKEAIEINNDSYIEINNSEYDKKLLQKRDFNYEIVNFLIMNSPNKEIYYKNTRGILLMRTKEVYGVSNSTIKRLFCNYLRNGKVIDSLIPQYSKCGGKGKLRISDKDNSVIDTEMIELFRKGIQKYYYTSKKIKIKTCYELIMRDYLKLNKNDNIPNIKQFYYWFSKLTENNKKNEITKRFGNRVYQQKGRAIIGSSLEDVVAPGDLYQVDSTILDFYIVSELNRNLIVGRPVMYLVIDTYSRMIVGVNVTIEPFNSYEGVKGALINAMTKKTNYCKRLGIYINKGEWNIKCIPNKILADRGELLSGNIENAISNLGIMIQNTPPYRGDMKGIVEKAFDRIHSYIKPFADGVVENKYNKIERGAEDYRLKANLTLTEITKIIVKCILFYNNNHVLRYYEGEEISSSNNIPKIPVKLWEYGIKNKKGLLRELPEKVIRLNLLSSKEATVTEKGIRFNKLYYVSKYTLSSGLYEKARIEGRSKIRISYDPNNISELYIIKEDGISFDKLELVNYMKQYNNLSEEEINILFKNEMKLIQRAEEDELKEKVKLYDEIDKITKNARQKQSLVRDRNLNKNSRLKNIRENLANEREYYKKSIDTIKSELVDYDDELDMFENLANEWGDEYE